MGRDCTLNAVALRTKNISVVGLAFAVSMIQREISRKSSKDGKAVFVACLNLNVELVLTMIYVIPITSATPTALMFAESIDVLRCALGSPTICQMAVEQH